VKILQITLLLLFVSFNSFSQNDEAEKIRSSVYQSNEEIGYLGYLLSELEFTKCVDSNSHFPQIKDFIRENIIKDDTLFIYTFGVFGYSSNEGKGKYDSLTLPYSFLYDDIYTGCGTDGCFYVGVQMYNEIIKNEITRRHGKDWEIDIQSKIDSIEPNIFKEE